MWTFNSPTKIYFGEDEVRNIPTYLTEIGTQRAFVICSPFTVRTGFVNALIELDPERIVGFSDAVEPNPTIENVDSCAAAVAEANADCIVALGGGSIMDCAKAVAVAVATGRSGAELIAGSSITGALPIIALPTTAGTASEVTAVTVLSDKDQGIKQPVASPLMFPRIAVVDPKLTVSCPPALTASTGLDA
ncbi:MAG TPA: iron-containing alcohol dehydrogenase, partial [Clostridiaceae bacterium]|nr:iron-containing alcohol dehydrogenase [Clostridiaceae bacterium]